MIILFKNLGWTSNWQESKGGLLFGVHVGGGCTINLGRNTRWGQHSMHLILTMFPPPPPTHSPPMHPFWIDAQIASKLSSKMQNIVRCHVGLIPLCKINQHAMKKGILLIKGWAFEVVECLT
jgi:hypothetical protein